MTLEQQRDVLDKTHKLLTDFCGKPPRGSVAPWYLSQLPSPSGRSPLG
jgi:peptidoglycan/xylan/chitin deacetylase (PgdA/CDA1 family)